MNKPLSLALALVLAMGASAARADNNANALPAAAMQDCVNDAKAMNDGRTDAAINQTCAARINAEQTRNKANNPSDAGTTDSNATTPSTSPPK